MPEPLKEIIWTKRIHTKVILRFLPVIILVPMLLAFVTYFGQKKSVTRIAGEHLRSVVTLKARGLDEYFAGGRDSLKILSNSPALKELDQLKLEGKDAERKRRQALGNIRGFLRGALKSDNQFEEFCILDPREGVVIVSTELKNEGKMFVNGDFFKQSLEDAVTDKVRRLPGDKFSVVYSSAPIGWLAELPIGILTGKHNMAPVFSLMAESSGLGENANSYLFDENFLLVTSPKKPGEPFFEEIIDTEGTRLVLKEKEGRGSYKGLKNATMIGAFQYLPGLGVGLIIEENLNAVLRSLYDLKKNLAAATVMVTLFAFFALWFISRQIVRPLSRLSQAVTRFSEGDFTVRSEIQDQDEIGRLSQNFNQMAASLEKLYGGLEEQVKKRTEELVNSLLETEEARAEWEDTFHAMNDALFIYDEKEMLRRLNHEGEEMAGKRESEARGLAIREILPILPAKNPAGIYPSNIELTHEGTGKIYRVSHFLKRDAKGVVQGGVFVYRDITEEKKREKEYGEVQSQLIEASKLAAVGTLSAGVAHEFNNLIAGIRLHADLALGNKTADKMERALKIAIDSSERATKIISSLLVFSRRKTSEKRPESLEEAVNETLGIIEAAFHARGIEVAKDFKPLPLVPIDRGQIAQVILNLLTNARDAVLHVTDPRIEINIYQLDKWACLEVKDNGTGIKEENKKKIFEPFFTTKGILGGGSESAPGTGLGLSISYGIVQSHHGTIEVKSEPAQGTSFTVKLPIETMEMEEKREEKAPARSASKKIKSKTVLVIDDEEPIRNAVKEALEGQGHKVWIARDGREGMEMIRQCEPDVIFLDFLMPGFSGPELIQKMNLKEEKSKIIAMSGVILEDMAELERLGVHAFLQKPFKVSELEKKFNEVMTS